MRAQLRASLFLLLAAGSLAGCSRNSALTNPHSPGFARINGVVSNMPEFQHAFSCKAGQPIVHAPACKVW